MTVFEATRAWRQLEGYLALVQDPILRNSMRYEFEKRAVKEWGFCPAETLTYKEEIEKPELTQEEQDIVDMIDAYLEYGVDPRTDEQKERTKRINDEALARMVRFVSEGHSYWEIPKDIRCDHIKEIYDKAMKIVFDVDV